MDVLKNLGELIKGARKSVEERASSVFDNPPPPSYATLKPGDVMATTSTALDANTLQQLQAYYATAMQQQAPQTSQLSALQAQTVSSGLGSVWSGSAQAFTPVEPAPHRRPAIITRPAAVITSSKPKNLQEALQQEIEILKGIK